ncbi:MAG: PqqD family protein [Candidatus Cryptobacteroides sp.]
MKIIDGFRMRTIAGESVVIGEGMAQINFNKLISLNSSAALLWQSVEGKEFTVDDLCKVLLENYDITEDVARKDSEAIAKAWIEAGIVSE